MSKIQTFTGRVVNPLALRAEDVDVVDIAHSLAMRCRFGGHCRYFYSVAQHAVLLSHAVEKVSPEHALRALHHDDAEAYCADIPRPVKPYLWASANFQEPVRLRSYRDFEKDVMLAIVEKLGLPPEEPGIVKLYDTKILRDEQVCLDFTSAGEWPAITRIGIQIEPWPWQAAKAAFLERHQELGGTL